jgi:periplasmic divalent cation tolerance protein
MIDAISTNRIWMMRRLRDGRFGADVRRRGVGLGSVVFGTRKNSTTTLRKVQGPMASDLILILTTMPDDDRAGQLARTLVEERLAACVNLHAAMTSTYRWHERVEVEPERQIVIKTTRDRLPALEARLRALHPYELPEFIVLDAAAGDAYARWVRDTTAPG